MESEPQKLFGNIPEDIDSTVTYELYLPESSDDQIIQKYKIYVSSILPSYNLNLIKDAKQCLYHGKVKFDGNIAEEWLVVYLLYELSKFDKELVIRVYDNDGDILLIEAADYLPRWLESSKSKNRVFIHHGKLHIIPEEVSLKNLLVEQKGQTVTHAAASFVRFMNKNDEAFETTSQTSQVPQKVKTLASRSIQNAIEEQLSGLPNKEDWLKKKYRQLDEIISESDGVENFQRKFEESLTLATVAAMSEEDLKTSPTSSVSTILFDSSSSSWLTEEEQED